MKIYMVVTEDKFELPVALFDSVKEMAKRCKTTENCIRANFSKQRHGAVKRSKYRCVEIEEETEE